MTVVVARTNAHGLEYLATVGAPAVWTEAAAAAAQFSTVRDATRTALRLPSRFRAFALPVHA